MDYDYLKYKKILIVDDEADLREMVTSILEQDGFKTIKTAGTVAEALKICRDWEPDLAILDVMLPDGNGFSLFEQMRTFTEVPVLFLTARGEDEDKLKGLGLGADDYMVKPFLPKELSLRIGIILRRYYKGEDPIVQLAGSQIDFDRAEVIKENKHFHLTMDTLAFGYILPTTGRIRDFNPLETCAARRTTTKSRPLLRRETSGIVAVLFRCTGR